MSEVKKPKWKKATGTEGAISVKGGAYPVKGTSVGRGKVRGEVSKLERRMDGIFKKKNKAEKVGYKKGVKAAQATRVIAKKPSKKSPSATKVEMKVTKAKRPVITHKEAVGISVAAGAGGAAVATRKDNSKKPRIYKKTTKPVVWRNSKRVGRTRVASKLRTEYDPQSDQWIKYTD